MAGKDMQELRNLSEPELNEKLAGLQQRLLEFRFQASIGRLEKPSEIAKARKNIARVLTIKRETEFKKNKGNL